ncbi:DNA-binding protein [Bosea vaviloviae]|uniref:DNA-binding protein n=2 Tax=Bosea vaviloviae TaxID=1526658 RepID=A0A1D7U485_9HYPH|nr:DNA-binding protein [Bosea vaviloviae]
MRPTMIEPRRSIAIPTGFLMVLRQGDDVFARLEALMREEAIPSAFISGLGFAGHVTFGFFDYEKKEYAPKTMRDLELTNLSGTLAWKDGKPSVHAHGTAGDDSFRTFGGHLLGLEVGRGSLEIIVTVIPTRLERAVDPGIGANVLQL